MRYVAFFLNNQRPGAHFRCYHVSQQPARAALAVIDENATVGTDEDVLGKPHKASLQPDVPTNPVVRVARARVWPCDLWFTWAECITRRLFVLTPRHPHPHATPSRKLHVTKALKRLRSGSGGNRHVIRRR